jgi:hypothetical protein
MAIYRTRSTKAEIRALKDVLLEIGEEHQPFTVRNMFYLTHSYGYIDKEERDYRKVQRLLGILREDGEMPFEWVVDNTRWMRKNASYSSAEHALRVCVQQFRRDLWEDQGVYPEVWCEADASAGILFDVTDKWDIPLMVSRGFSSKSFLWSAAQEYKELDGKCVFIMYFGDHDQHGKLIEDHIERDLRRFAPNVDLTFVRVAVRDWQIEKWNLPTRPPKVVGKGSDKKWIESGTVQLEAIPPKVLRGLLKHVIEKIVDKEQLESIRRIEREERAQLEHMLNTFNHAA